MDVMQRNAFGGHQIHVDLYDRLYRINHEILATYLPGLPLHSSFIDPFKDLAARFRYTATESTLYALRIIFDFLQDLSKHSTSLKFSTGLEKLFRLEYDVVGNTRHGRRSRHSHGVAVPTFEELGFILSPEVWGNDLIERQLFSYMYGIFTRYWGQIYYQDPKDVMYCLIALDQMESPPALIKSVLEHIAQKPEILQELIEMIWLASEMEGVWVLSEETVNEMMQLLRRKPGRAWPGTLTTRGRGGRRPRKGPRRNIVNGADVPLRGLMKFVLDHPSRVDMDLSMDEWEDMMSRDDGLGAFPHDMKFGGRIRGLPQRAAKGMLEGVPGLGLRAFDQMHPHAMRHLM